MTTTAPQAGDGAAQELIRVLIADDHPVFRNGLAGIVDALPGIQLVGQAGDGEEAVLLADQAHPDVVVMDLHMPKLNGVEATRRITASHPDVSVLVLTMLEDDTSLFSALQAGARGYLLKEADPDDIARAIRSVAAGEALIDGAVATRVLAAIPATPRPAAPPPFPRLTTREREILSLLARGLSNAAIAERMFLSDKTVRNYVSTIFTKIHVSDRAAAVSAARDAGLGNDI